MTTDNSTYLSALSEQDQKKLIKFITDTVTKEVVEAVPGLKLRLSAEAVSAVGRLARMTGDLQSDLLFKALAFYEKAWKAHLEGMTVAIVDPDLNIVEEFVGFEPKGPSIRETESVNS